MTKLVSYVRETRRELLRLGILVFLFSKIFLVCAPLLHMSQRPRRRQPERALHMCTLRINFERIDFDPYLGKEPGFRSNSCCRDLWNAHRCRDG